MRFGARPMIRVLPSDQGTSLPQSKALRVNLKDGRQTSTHTRKSMKRRDAIIRTATEVINAKSYALATMSEIAAKLDLRDAALYYYFSDKQALGFACHVQSLDRIQGVLDATEARGGDGLTKLEHFIKGMLQDSVDNGPQLYLGDFSYLNDVQREAVGAWVEKLKSRVEAYLRTGMADGTVVDCEPELVVQLLLGMLVWLAKWTPGVEGLTVERLMAAIGAFSFHGLERRSS